MGMFNALIATNYVVEVAFFAVLTLAAFDKHVILRWLGGSGPLRKYLVMIECLAALVTELALHILISKWILIKLTRVLGGFNYSLASLAYFVDVINLFGLAMLYFESLQEREIIEEAIKDLTGGDPVEPVESILSSSKHANLLWNPMSTPPNVHVYPNITYATNEEVAEAIGATNDYDQPRKMMLDIYTSSPQGKGKQLRPVHIHGGSWRTGSKNLFYPHEKLLVSEGDWVIVNIGYRLAPKNAYPTHLCDVKRALRWVKRSISSFGGDPDFVVLSGDSTGGHLASMAAFTANQPQYQPGFEEVDTSVCGVISLNGVLDLESDPVRSDYFARTVALQDKVDMEFIREHSPISNIMKAKAEGKLVPFLLFTGERDSMVDSSMAKEFKKVYIEATGPEPNEAHCCVVALPAAHHICYASWSPRAFYISRMILKWCQQLQMGKKQ
ncbi:hypothetical protein EC973_009684 [Apophysomyces ossiformis]|uniref:BD-FAE-like domain-containing protein n=1 Tax=Apophysomyces ossiformis TaxID=679940 RepID=A0A8H7BRN3_9FUNG|nr:hypothetical protein EC973_009684 [Apophysomyces ossiformis]